MPGTKRDITFSKLVMKGLMRISRWYSLLALTVLPCATFVSHYEIIQGKTASDTLSLQSSGFSIKI
jgi:hypothetical protein